MRAFAYMKTKIFLQSEGRTGSMGEDATAFKSRSRDLARDLRQRS